MPLDKTLKKVMVIGSGPIVIGQAAEFDYAGTQACRALREEGVQVVLVNSNPATIMTDRAMADAVYIEPLTIPVLKNIILKEKPDGILSTLGGQTGLTLSMQLAEEGFLEEQGVRLLGADPETIHRAEDRKAFKGTMEQIGEPVIPSVIANDLPTAIRFANEAGYPVIVRPAFTLGGTGGGVAQDEQELKQIALNGLRSSPIHQILVEKSVAGWKEIEFEVMRDKMGNSIAVCSMENLDPVGVHTGDSIVIAPAVTLADREYQMLRRAALKIVDSMGVVGGCNCQFALNPGSFEYAVIEVNPRVSRSSALASKATGYPIAKVATKIALGYDLGEIKNAVTGKTSACFEPALDYVVVKLPKWPFDKFAYATRTLGTQMKATGEVMAIGITFEEALMKAVRGAELGLGWPRLPELAALEDYEVEDRLHRCDDTRLFAVYEALLRGISPKYICGVTGIDKWFVMKLKNLALTELELSKGELTSELYRKAKAQSWPDWVIEKLSGCKPPERVPMGFRMVDTCAGEFPCETPYFYSAFGGENEAKEFIESKRAAEGEKKTVVVFGSGPIRIGQGVEFDYASVHCVWALKRKGFDVVIVNNNPETVSTDFDTADRLYFEPLTPEDVSGILETEKPFGVVVSFGGQTAIKLTKFLAQSGANILGTSADSIDRAEDRERFEELLEELNISRPKGFGVETVKEAVSAAGELGYPVLVRPSYVLGGQNMTIAFGPDEVVEYMEAILKNGLNGPVLVDKYLMGTEVEVDAISDGEDILIPGIMRHIERSGIHSGDSIAVWPADTIGRVMVQKIVDQSKKLAHALRVKGLINIQYVIYENELYVIEVNPRSSRTVPYISKVTGVPMVDLSTRCMLGEKLSDMGYGTDLYKKGDYVAVKVPVFSFEKLSDVDISLGPEMKSTGEVLGVAKTMAEALYKGLVAAGYRLERTGGAFFTLRDSDKWELPALAEKYKRLGFKIYATEGTAKALAEAGIPAIRVGKIHESGGDNALSLIDSGAITYVISTTAKGREPARDGMRIRRRAVERRTPCFTALDTANAVADCLLENFRIEGLEVVDINHLQAE
ncbi:MAG: carbamoyl-phosphate synthase large subunit [Christensenellales bacterium]|jgi:carbamoyl-phosphate synthase large subunit